MDTYGQVGGLGIKYNYKTSEFLVNDILMYTVGVTASLILAVGLL